MQRHTGMGTTGAVGHLHVITSAGKVDAVNDPLSDPGPSGSRRQTRRSRAVASASCSTRSNVRLVATHEFEAASMVAVDGMAAATGPHGGVRMG